MNYPSISIVTPVYNQVQHIEDTILSVLSQGYPNLEYIIIDGGSTDGTVDVIRRYASRLHYWVSEPHHGMYDAIQKGFEHSTGDIMAWIGSDDMYHPRSLFAVGKIFATLPDVEWLEGATTYYNTQGETIEIKQSRPFTQNHFLCGDFRWIQQESTFWRRSLWDKAGGHVSTQLKYAGDYELWLRFFRHSQLYVTNCLLGGFRMRGAGQLSHDHHEDYLNEVFRLIEVETIPEQSRAVMARYQRNKRICQCLDRLHLPFRKTLCEMLMQKALPLPSHYRIAYNTEREQYYIV